MLQYSWDRKKVFFSLSRLLMHFSKQGKYFVVNKSATSAPCCHSYIKLLYLFTQISTIKIPKVFFFFLKNRISGKIQKNQIPVDRTCFTSIWEEWHSYLDWKITLYLNFYLNNHQKSQSLKTYLLLTQNRNFFCQNNLMIITKTKW